MVLKKANQNKRKTLNGDIVKKQLMLQSSKQDHENEKQITENISEWLILHGHFQSSRFVKSSLGMSFDKKQAKCKLIPLGSNSAMFAAGEQFSS